MKPVQMRMARAALGWGVRDLAERAGVTANTVTRIENGADAKQSTIEALRSLGMEGAGVEFVAEERGYVGVRVREGSYRKGCRAMSGASSQDHHNSKRTRSTPSSVR